MAVSVLSYRSRQGDTVDLIVWRHYGRQDGRLVEKVLDANPGLADLGLLLPLGTEVVLPAIEEETGAVEVARLWG